MALEPGIEQPPKNARRRPIQPVVPVVPYVAPRKAPVKSQVEEKSDDKSTAQISNLPVGEVTENRTTLDADASEELKSNVTPAEAVFDFNHGLESSAYDPGQSEAPIPVTDGATHVNGDLVSSAESENDSKFPEFQDPKRQDAHEDEKQLKFLEHPEPPNHMEDISNIQEKDAPLDAEPNIDTEKSPAGRHVPMDVPVDTDKTPTLFSKETTTAEVVDQKPQTWFPHRKSEVAPEVLTNGHERKYSDNTNQRHQSSSSVSSQRAPLPTIYEHFLYLFNSKQMCDTIIQVNSPEQMTPPIVHYAHAVFLIRSERIAKLLPELDAQPQSRIINLYPARTIQPYAFEAALRFLYSDHVLSAEALFPRDLTTDKQVRAHLLDYLMSYWIAGVELGLEPVKTRSYDFLKDFVDWDVIEMVMKEAYNLRALVPVTETGPPSESAVISKAIFIIIARFIVDRINLTHFKLDIDVQSNILPSRFSQLEPGRAMANPALASMVFGSMPSHSITSPSADTVASTVFLNMDFIDLEALAVELVSWHSSDAVNVLREVIEEREKRRIHVISNRMVPNKQRLSNSAAWENAGWREYMEDGALKRERVGFLLPTKQR